MALLWNLLVCVALLGKPHAAGRAPFVGSTPRALYESALNQLHGHRLSASNGYANWATCEREAAFAAALRTNEGRRLLIALLRSSASACSFLWRYFAGPTAGAGPGPSCASS